MKPDEENSAPERICEAARAAVAVIVQMLGIKPTDPYWTNEQCTNMLAAAAHALAHVLVDLNPGYRTKQSKQTLIREIAASLPSLVQQVDAEDRDSEAPITVNVARLDLTHEGTGRKGN
jgi:hypothetical protein